MRLWIGALEIGVDEFGRFVSLPGKMWPYRSSVMLIDACPRTFSRNGLDQLGLATLDDNGIGKLDSIDRIDDLRLVGQMVAKRDLRPELFTGFLD